MKAFPGTVKGKDKISPELMAHLRYPQDLFKVQRQLLTKYHVTNAAQFYSGSEVWQVPDDPAAKTGKAVPPYYLSLQMPDQSAQSFSLTTTFTPSKRDNLSAFMSVDANATSKDYGAIRLLKLPPSSTVDGPQQVQSKLNSDPKVAPQINQLKRAGADSTVEYGNLLTVPLAGGLMYVEPVYVRGAGTNYPLMRSVLVTYGNQIGFKPTLGEALDEVFGVDGSTTPTPPSTGKPTQPAPDPTVAAALTEAQKALDASQEALKTLDWAKYGEAQKQLAAALQKAVEAEQKAAKKG